MRKVIIIFAAALLLTGCNPCARLARRCPPVSSDTVRVVRSEVVAERIIDTVRWVGLPAGDIERYGADTVRAETGLAEAVAFTDAQTGLLRLLLRNKVAAPLPVRLEARERVIESDTVYLSSETRVVEINRLKGWQKGLMGCGVTALLIAAGWVVFRLARR